MHLIFKLLGADKLIFVLDFHHFTHCNSLVEPLISQLMKTQILHTFLMWGEPVTESRDLMLGDNVIFDSDQT